MAMTQGSLVVNSSKGAGSLSTTQAVVSLLDERSKAPADRNPSILEAPSMFQVATIVGKALREVVKTYAAKDKKPNHHLARH